MPKAKLKETPEAQENSGYATLQVGARDLGQYLKKIKPFISEEETRYYLNGVLMTYADKKLTLVATNGHILQKRVINISPEIDGKSFSVICPRETIDNLIMILSHTTLERIYDEDDEYTGDRQTCRYNNIIIKVSDSDKRKQGKISFDFLDFEITVKTIDGIFPDYKKVIPDQNVGLETGFNADHIKSVLAAFDVKGVNVFVKALEGSNKEPHVFTQNKQYPDAHNSELLCIVMPMRA